MTESTLQTEKSDGFFKKLLNGIKDFFIGFGQGCKDFFINFGIAIKNFFKDPKTGFKNIWKWLKKQNGWLFLAPAIILMAIFTFYPIFNSLRLAFLEDYNPLDKFAPDPTFGFGNFKQVIEGGITAADFGVCLKNTLILAFISVPFSTMVALLISVALNSIKALQKAYQTIFFLPYLTNALAMGAVFASFFQIIGTNSNIETYGLVNQFLSLFGAGPINWIDLAKGGLPASTEWANYAVLIIYSTWSGLPFKILIIFSALQNVGKQYYDAAKIDGANKTTILTKITVPLISPMISYLIITGFMGALKSYSSVVGIFGANMGPNGDFEMGTMVGYIYKLIENNQIAYAAAGSLILFAIILVVTIINNVVSKKTVHY